MNPADRASRIRHWAREIGFDDVGFARPDPLERNPYYRAWLAAGRHGDMDYLARNRELRGRPDQLLPGVRSVICVALSYHRPHPAAADPRAALAPGDAGPTGRIAAYARGADYHVVLRGMLEALGDRIRAAFGAEIACRACVDTAPVVERELAARAGIGWIGKNTLVLNRRLGSWFVLGELFTTLDIPPDAPASDHCGSCTRCLDACPTGAFPAPYEMDAARCISYYTIEHRGALAESQRAAIGDWLFGCDICQQVCPHNARAAPGTSPALTEPRLPERLPLAPLRPLRSGTWRRLTRGSAMRRASRAQLERNAAIVFANLEADAHG